MLVPYGPNNEFVEDVSGDELEAAAEIYDRLIGQAVKVVVRVPSVHDVEDQ